MGVMACDRPGCDNIMCSRLVLNDSRYVCDDCWNDLLEMRATWTGEMTGRDIAVAIADFFRASPTGEPLEPLPGSPWLWNRVLRGNGVEDTFRRLTGQPTRRAKE